ncbi:MAG: hypothetical protein JO317_01085 [Verrucomicrobiae bacterium]|nr:hypothetical protein [Verrucomicrobiae bacterium]
MTASTPPEKMPTTMTMNVRTIVMISALATLLAPFSRAIEVSESKPEGGYGGPKIDSGVDPKEAKKPSLLQNPFKWLFGHSDPTKRLEAPPELDLDLQVGKANYSSAEDDAIQVKMVALNKSDHKFILRFPTAQHFDFTIRDAQGQEKYRWSSDKNFAEKLSTIVVNANEKLSYPGIEPLLIPLALDGKALPPGRYELVGVITAETPIKISKPFEVAPEGSSKSARPAASNTDSTSPAVPADQVDASPPEQ